MKAIVAKIRVDLGSLREGQEVKIIHVEGREACVVNKSGDLLWVTTGDLVADYNSI